MYIIRSSIILFVCFIMYARGYNTGFRDAVDIALGKKYVKWSKDFMKDYRKTIGWRDAPVRKDYFEKEI